MSKDTDNKTDLLSTMANQTVVSRTAVTSAIDALCDFSTSEQTSQVSPFIYCAVCAEKIEVAGGVDYCITTASRHIEAASRRLLRAAHSHCPRRHNDMWIWTTIPKLPQKYVESKGN